ncbi:site-specific DNA-methyltransferase [Flavobacteriaceae bacterium]|nr:site-specific DNA-methyltransferase [Flavobacteriaceae bacterium]
MVELDKVYFESCLETMKRMEDGSVDCVITSPPYNMNLRIRKGEYCSRQIVKELSTKYSSFDDNLPIDEYNTFHSNVLSELLRVSKVVFYNVQIVTGSKRSVFKMMGDFNEHLKDIIVWDKGVAQPAMQKQVLNRRTELILVFETDYPISRQYRYANFERGKLNDIWEIKRGKKISKDHGATFPDDLVARILENFTNENEVVYDPFMGTGTTAVVSKKMKRRFIGSEIGKDYFDLIEKRLGELNNELQF